MTRTLTEANENSIWGKLYQNKMDGLDSFYSFKNGLEHILNKSKVAYLQNGEQIRYFEDYHCKVRTINIHQIYLYILVSSGTPKRVLARQGPISYPNFLTTYFL